VLEKLEGKSVPQCRIGWLRARGQVQRKEFPSARRTLEHVIANGKALGPRVLLSQILFQEGRDWAAAEGALRDVLTVDRTHAETKHNLTVLLRRLGKGL